MMRPFRSLLKGGRAPGRAKDVHRLLDKMMTHEELLKYAIKCGKLDLAQVQADYAMEEKRKIIEQHRYKIWEGKDGKWRTYLPEINNDRRLVKRNTRESIEDAIVAFYKGKEANSRIITFEDAYFKWRTYQEQLVGSNTITKYESDYRRYFENVEFCKQNIEAIGEDEVKLFICRTVKEKKLCKEACKTLFSYLNRTFYRAVRSGMIQKNPMDDLGAKDFYRYCTERKRTADTLLVSDTEMVELYERFYNDHEKKSGYIPTYAVELASLTGMRVGEISGLTWDKIKDSYIIVNQSEKYDRRKKTYFIDDTKNVKERIIPLTEEIRDLLERVRKAEMENGYLCEWVFADEDGRIHAPVISSCSKNKCRQLKITEKGIHAYRRTVNSKMRCAGVPVTVAASLLGHSEAVNVKYYTFDVSGLDEKMKILESVNQKMPTSH